MSVKRFIPAIGWFIFSLVLLCLPGSAIPKVGWFAKIQGDKLVHILLFFILCFLSSQPMRKSGRSKAYRIKWFIMVLFGGVLYGTAMEFVQKDWVPNRSFEAWDILADSMGCLVAYVYSRSKWTGD